MNAFTVPVSMIAAKGKGGLIAAGVIGLLIVLALAAKNSPAQTPATR
jgi:hypothetical protein